VDHPIAPTRLDAASRWTGLRSLVGALSLCIVPLAGAIPAAAQSIAAKVQGDQTAGYARMVFRFDDMPDVSARISNGILVVAFDKAVDVPVDRLPSTLSDYVAGVRRDPDGKGVRFALSRRVRISTMQAGDRLFVDLLPESWTKAAPSLPQDVGTAASGMRRPRHKATGTWPPKRAKCLLLALV